MPKVVDNYVLERKIGSGQFGEVFKGYNKINNQDIAIKCVNRKMLKGKFTELLENEIKVLRTCNNENIIKLYDIKKTANNIYLIMEYCNEGDLSRIHSIYSIYLLEYLKQRKYLTEEEAVDFFLQILNGFKTLVKNKVIHRDFKLANILKHEGQIKIADFGFAKLVPGDGFASTMLGSPLNMAPEVLNNQDYNNKADIWSIGTVFYEILFGKPPFTAANMVDLLKNIQRNPVQFNKRINSISPVCEDVIKKMLVVDPKKRINWDELFKHQINTYQEEKLKKELDDTMRGEDIIGNVSKFYINNNKVIDHPAEISKKQDLNNFAMQLAKGQNSKQQQYQGQLMKKPQEEGEKRIDQNQPNSSQSTQQDEEQKMDGEVTDKETQREYEIRIRKKNANRILHERNIYVFLASVAEEAMTYTSVNNHDLVGYLLVKKLLQCIDYLDRVLSEKKNVFKLENWENFTQSKDFQDIHTYISKELDVFQFYFQSMYNKKIKNNPRYKQGMIKEEVRQCINENYKQNIENIIPGVVKSYCQELLKFIKQQATNDAELVHKQLVHADRIMDCLNMNKIFQFEITPNTQFNFKQYYEECSKLDVDQLQKQVVLKFEKS